jgi:hypothetical protein
MKVKALARLSTVSGWKLPGEEFVVNAAEADALVARGLVERSAEAADSQDPAPQKAPKTSKANG